MAVANLCLEQDHHGITWVYDCVVISFEFFSGEFQFASPPLGEHFSRP